MTLVLRPALDADSDAVANVVDRAHRHYVELIGVRPGPMDADYEQVIRDLVLAVRDEGCFIDNIEVAPSQKGTGVG